MKKFNKLFFCLSVILLSSCSQNNSPASLEARHYVYRSLDDSNPNYKTHIYNSIQSMTPFFDQFYQEGKIDKLSGLSVDDAKNKMQMLESDEYINSIISKSKDYYISPKVQTIDIDSKNFSEKRKKYLTNGIINMYKKGYYGT
ncbi:Exc2 family lipoprotein [Arsenophonus nasoniae]|uniref:Exc2 family lipoprotein n=1 Tax=Arsenophonus nasoniae TaxID=638 RepID=A0AA95KF90_9GAMM|nr:Exc2 family lipoprotein [Arsenophonus nasoniae]WGM03684.1 Exc2 family lipoprotein [Arsenophonus nasoniae]